VGEHQFLVLDPAAVVDLTVLALGIQGRRVLGPTAQDDPTVVAVVIQQALLLLGLGSGSGRVVGVQLRVHRTVTTAAGAPKTAVVERLRAMPLLLPVELRVPRGRMPLLSGF